MTGPAEGKLPVEAKVFFVVGSEKKVLEDAEVYIHLKGYSLARVTHLDIEHSELNKAIPPKRGGFFSIRMKGPTLEIDLGEKGRVLVEAPLLTGLLGISGKTRTWVGGKFGGIYVGFRKPEIERLERLAESKFGAKPRSS